MNCSIQIICSILTVLSPAHMSDFANPAGTQLERYNGNVSGLWATNLEHGTSVPVNLRLCCLCATQC